MYYTVLSCITISYLVNEFFSLSSLPLFWVFFLGLSPYFFSPFPPSPSPKVWVCGSPCPITPEGMAECLLFTSCLRFPSPAGLLQKIRSYKDFSSLGMQIFFFFFWRGISCPLPLKMVQHSPFLPTPLPKEQVGSKAIKPH